VKFQVIDENPIVVENDGLEHFETRLVKSLKNSLLAPQKSFFIPEMSRVP